MNHGDIVRLSVDKYVATRVAHEAPTASPAKLPRSLPTHNTLPSHISMSLTVVEAAMLEGADPAARHIHPNEGFHQVPCKDVMPQLPAKHL
jgi:hypothetical protein